jgi:hypothetical protein
MRVGVCVSVHVRICVSVCVSVCSVCVIGATCCIPHYFSNTLLPPSPSPAFYAILTFLVTLADGVDDTDAAAADEDIAMAMSQPGTSHTLFSRDCMPAWVSVT